VDYDLYIMSVPTTKLWGYFFRTQCKKLVVVQLSTCTLQDHAATGD